jgi:hypothetical protein
MSSVHVKSHTRRPPKKKAAKRLKVKRSAPPRKAKVPKRPRKACRKPNKKASKKPRQTSLF